MRWLLWGAASLQAWAAWCGISLSPDTLEFGTLVLGQRQSRVLMLTNGGTEEVALLAAEVRQWSWSGFTVLSPVPMRLPPGQAVPIEVQAEVRHNVECWGLLLLRLRCVEAEWTAWCVLHVRGTDPDTLYRGTEGLWGEALRQRLRELVQAQRVFPYDSARQLLFLTVENRNGVVECLYTGQTIRVPPMPSPTVFNVEHVWPRSYGADTLPPLSDLHHLFPALAEANEKRGNFPYGIVQQVSWQFGGSRQGTDSRGVQVFEPRESVRGDVARALFYVALRYGNMRGFLTAADEALLRQWYWLDTVDSWERERTQRVARLQGRANPFVERPQLLERLWQLSGSADFPAIPAVVCSDTLLEYAGQEREWILNLGLLNVGWGVAQVRAVELLSAPAGVVFEPLSCDSLLAPGAVGRCSVRLAASEPVVGQVRLRLRFAAGVRPLEVVLRLHAPSGVSQEPEARIDAETLRLRWHFCGEQRQPVRVQVYTLTGQAFAVDGVLFPRDGRELELVLDRTRLPRGFLLFCLHVGERRLWKWAINP